MKERSNTLKTMTRYRYSTKRLSFHRLYAWIKNRIFLRYTVILVPHSERSPVKFQVSILFFCVVVMLLVAASITFMVSGSRYITTSQQAQTTKEELEQAEASLSQALEGVTDFVQSSDLFYSALSSTLEEAEINVDTDALDLYTPQVNDFNTITQLQEMVGTEPIELLSLRSANAKLHGSITPLEELRNIIASQQNLLQTIPNRWPIANNHGRVTMEFGPNIHPITGQWYLHKGFDIAGVSGAQVLASAAGKIIEVGYDPGYGLHVWIKHKYGFKTHYSHLSKILVKEGDEVEQGELIGRLGNTGISTGPHLDFQVIIGTDVVDPASFLQVSNSFQRWSGNR